MNNYKSNFFCLILFFNTALSYGGWDSNLIQNAKDTISMFKKKDKNMDKFFKSALGYAVFSNVGKGGLGIGGMNGDGVLFENGTPVGYTELTAVTIGFQAGGQAFREIIFFKDKKVLENFKNGDLKFNAQVSAVAVTAGASADANYKSGVAVFTMAKGGLMYEASVGGQKFSFEKIKGK